MSFDSSLLSHSCSARQWQHFDLSSPIAPSISLLTTYRGFRPPFRHYHECTTSRTLCLVTTVEFRNLRQRDRHHLPSSVRVKVRFDSLSHDRNTSLSGSTLEYEILAPRNLDGILLPDTQIKCRFSNNLPVSLSSIL